MANDNNVNKRKVDISSYKTIANRMPVAAANKTGAMIVLEKHLEETHRKRNNISEFFNDQDNRLSNDEYDPVEFSSSFKKAQAADARFDETIKHTEAKIEAEKSKREQIARNQFESSAKGLAENTVRPSVDVARHRIEARTAIASGKYNESSVESGIDRVGAQLKTRTQNLIDQANDPKGTHADYIKAAEQLETSKDKHGMLTEAHKEIRRQGFDTASILDSSLSKNGSILDRRQNEDLAYKVASGGGGSMKEQSGNLQQKEEDFTKALEKFTEAISSGTGNIEGLKKSLVDSSKALDDQSKLVKEMQKQGAGGGGDILRGIATAGQAVSIGANIYTNATVASENQQMALRAGFARFQNENGFMTQAAAAQGDMSAYLRMFGGSGSSYKRAVKFGTEQQDQQTLGNYAGIAGTGLTAFGEAGLEFAEKASVAAPLAGPAAALKKLMGSAQQAASQTIDQTRGLSAGQAALTGAGASRELDDAVNQVRSIYFSEYKNTSVGNLAASQGFGGKRSDAMANMQSSRMAMAGLGMNAEDTQSLYQTAVGSMGAEFTKRGAGGMQSLVQRSAEVGRSGVTSAQDYLSRIGQMAQAGGGDKQIEDIMANAVARGVDDAKSFGAMVDSISSLSSGAASKGIDITSTMTRNVSASMDSLKGNGMNTQLNLNEAQQQAKHIADMTSDTGMNYASYVEQAGLSKLGGSMLSRAALAKTQLPELQEVQRLVKENKFKEAREIANKGGYGSQLFEEDGTAKNNINEKAQSLVDVKEDKTGANMQLFASKASINAAMNKVRSGKKLDTTEHEILKAGGYTEAGMKQIYDGKVAKGEIKPPTGDVEAGYGIKGAEAKSRAKQAESGEMDSGGLSAIAKNMQIAAEGLAPIADAIKAATSAATMKLETGTFDNSVAKFATAVEQLMVVLGAKKSTLPTEGSRPAAEEGRFRIF